MLLCVFINARSASRGFTHNADTYSEPLDFKPERYLAENGSVPEKDPRAHAFGYGRRYFPLLYYRMLFHFLNYLFRYPTIRICPGKELAEASLFTEIAMILATFSVAKAKDANGNIIEPCTEVTSGVVWYVHQCNLLTLSWFSFHDLVTPSNSNAQ